MRLSWEVFTLKIEINRILLRQTLIATSNRTIVRYARQYFWYKTEITFFSKSNTKHFLPRFDKYKIQMSLCLIKTTKGGDNSNDTFPIFLGAFFSLCVRFSSFLYVCGCDLIIPTNQSYAAAINFNLCSCYGLLFNFRLLFPTNRCSD